MERTARHQKRRSQHSLSTSRMSFRTDAKGYGAWTVQSTNINQEQPNTPYAIYFGKSIDDDLSRLRRICLRREATFFLFRFVVISRDHHLHSPRNKFRRTYLITTTELLIRKLKLGDIIKFDGDMGFNHRWSVLIY